MMQVINPDKEYDIHIQVYGNSYSAYLKKDLFVDSPSITTNNLEDLFNKLKILIEDREFIRNKTRK